MGEYKEKEFIKALNEYGEALEEGKPVDERIVVINRFGLFITYRGIQLNYGVQSFQDDPEDYLKTQLERNRSYLNSLDRDIDKTSQELSTYKRSWLSALFFSKLSDDDDIEDRIKDAEIALSRSKLLRQGAVDCRDGFFKKLLVHGEEGLLQEYFNQTFRDFSSLDKLNDYNEQLVSLMDKIYGACDNLVNLNTRKHGELQNRLAEYKGLHG